MKRIIALMLSAGVAGCAQPTTKRPDLDPTATEEERRLQILQAAKHLSLQADQLMRVHYRLSQAGADLCGEHVAWTSGMAFWSLSWGTPGAKAGWRLLFPFLTDGISVRYIVPGSPAEKAGLRVGDAVLRVNGAEVSRDKDDAIKQMDGWRKSADAVTVVVKRGDEERTIAVPPERACSYKADIAPSAVVNAFADGATVKVTRGMMDFVKNDEELALVVGHEMAHDFRGHLDAKRQNELGGRIAGAVLDGLVAAATRTMPGNTGQSFGGALASQAYSVDFEAEADYVGLYVMARAGYPISDAPTFWRRMGAANPQSVTLTTTHPATPERFVALKAAVAEIEAKKAKGEPLLPNEKQDGIRRDQ